MEKTKVGKKVHDGNKGAFDCTKLTVHSYIIKELTSICKNIDNHTEAFERGISDLYVYSTDYGTTLTIQQKNLHAAYISAIRATLSIVSEDRANRVMRLTENHVWELRTHWVPIYTLHRSDFRQFLDRLTRTTCFYKPEHHNLELDSEEIEKAIKLDDAFRALAYAMDAADNDAVITMRKSPFKANATRRYSIASFGIRIEQGTPMEFAPLHTEAVVEDAAQRMTGIVKAEIANLKLREEPIPKEAFKKLAGYKDEPAFREFCKANGLKPYEVRARKHYYLPSQLHGLQRPKGVHTTRA